jgi:hypothetical protein
MTRTTSSRKPPATRPKAVSRPHDPAETQADKAADVVARGGSVAGWSFGAVPVEAEVHREEKGKPGDDEKLKKAAAKVGEAALETEAGKKLRAQVKETPLVKQATEFLGTTPGKVIAGGAVAAGVGGLAAAKQPLPFQAPAIPLDKITPGLSAKVTVEGPVNAPTFVGLSLTYKEQGKGGKAGPTEGDKIAADTARLRAQAELFKPQAQKDQEKADEQAAIARYVASQQKRFGSSTLLPLRPGDSPKTVDVPKTAAPEASDKDKDKDQDDAPVQREPATTNDHEAGLDTGGVDTGGIDTGGIDAVVRGGGRALDPATRRSMEARFGHDFASVRVHDDAGAASAASDVRARAFTVGDDIVLGEGGYDPSTPEGRHLLAHELAHVVQQRNRSTSGDQRLQRRSFLDSVGILLGVSEGTWTDRELRAYLDQVTASDRTDGSYDADNKARAIVGRWKQGSPGWDLLGPQKALLIDEMLEGPTLDDDEQCILDLLELSDAGDVRTIFAEPQKRIAALDSDLHGAEQTRLDTFVASRIKGGRAELEAGRVEVLGPPVPVGAPSFAWSAAAFDALLDSDRSAPELTAVIDRLSVADRSKALDHLLHDVWPRSKDRIGKAAAEAADAPSEAEQQAIEEKVAIDHERVRKSERILQHAFLGEVPATKEGLKTGTRPADPGLAAELREALRPKQYTAAPKKIEPGPDPTPKEPAQKPAQKPAQEPADESAPAERVEFHDPAKYRAEVEDALPDIIDGKYKIAVTDRGARAKSAEIESMAVIAKKETDSAFGEFYDKSKHPELLFDRKGKPGKLHFWYDEAERERKTYGDPVLARGWLLYYFQSDSVIRALNNKYAAAPEFDKFDTARNDEAKVVVKIVDKALQDKETVRKLVETRRGWGGMAGGGNIYVDLFHDTDTDTDRLAGWEMLQTLVHEYLHTLVHTDYRDFAKSFGTTSTEWNTLIEGVDCILDEVVWARLEPKVNEPAIRKTVEGETNAKLDPLEVPPPARYPSYDEAFRLVGLVGAPNVYAAYFLGLVDRVAVQKLAPKASKTKKKAKP